LQSRASLPQKQWGSWLFSTSVLQSSSRSWTGDDPNRPVLKHGPRSSTCARVEGLKTWRRNESNRWDGVSLALAPSTEPEAHPKVLSGSVHVETRKIANYACIGRSQKKFWWRLVAVLTCKSIVKCAYSGERLIELSSSWFPSKFPSG